MLIYKTKSTPKNTTSIFNHSAAHGKLFLIKVPPKIWRPKPNNHYASTDTYDDIDDDIFEYKPIQNIVFKLKLNWDDNPRNDIINFNPDEDTKELMKDIRIGASVTSPIQQRLLEIVKTYWDCFATKGARRTIIGYEFGIDTGSAKPACCPKPQYGYHESNIIMEQVTTLLKNLWIEECEGPWGSMIVLAPKPHQEHIKNIEDSIWRMCVSYRKLNAVTKPYESPIPRCDDAITNLGGGSPIIFFISMDAFQGYHQVKVREQDKEKLAFFAPNNRKYTFTVMPFGPMNAPAFYSKMMLDFKKEWTTLFLMQIRNHTSSNGDTFTVLCNTEVLVNSSTRLIFSSKTIIDDILLWCSHTDALLLLMECVCKVFRKYRVSFRLKKCDFLKDRVEYVGHDITNEGNCPAQSKFNLINDW